MVVTVTLWQTQIAHIDDDFVAAYAYGAGYGVFAVASKQGPGDNYLRQIVIKEGLPDYSEEEAASLNYPNWLLLRQSAISTMSM